MILHFFSSVYTGKDDFTINKIYNSKKEIGFA